MMGMGMCHQIINEFEEVNPLHTIVLELLFSA